MKPRSRGTVRLRSRDPEAAPRVVLNYLDDPYDLDAFVRMMLLIEEVYDQATMKEVREQLLWRPSSVDRAEMERVARAGALTDHHEAGSVPIGPVLDPHLRVHGIDALRVCDASIFPDPPRCNTNFPTMMAAERCSGGLQAAVGAPRFRAVISAPLCTKGRSHHLRRCG